MQNPKIPILIVAHQRSNYLSKVIEAAIKCQPSSIYVSVDGPRGEILGETERVAKCRNIVETKAKNSLIPFKIKFRDINIGCAANILDSIDWLFDSEPNGLILEEDCLPEISAVQMVSQQLKLCENYSNIWMVSGFRPTVEGIEIGKSFLTHLPLGWGWGTWAHKWKDMRESILNDAFNNNFYKNLTSNSAQVYWNIGARRASLGWIDTWDLQLADAMLRNDKLNLVGPLNQISNIGVDSFSLHTEGKNEFLETGTSLWRILDFNERDLDFSKTVISNNDKNIWRFMIGIRWHHKYLPIIKYLYQRITKFQSGRGPLKDRLKSSKF